MGNDYRMNPLEMAHYFPGKGRNILCLPVFIFPKRGFVFDMKSKNTFYLYRNSWWLYVCILRDICSLHRCAGCHELHIKWKWREAGSPLLILKQGQQFGTRSGRLTVPALPSERWLICCASGAIMEAGCSDIDGSIEGDITVPWKTWQQLKGMCARSVLVYKSLKFWPTVWTPKIENRKGPTWHPFFRPCIITMDFSLAVLLDLDNRDKTAYEAPRIN